VQTTPAIETACMACGEWKPCTHMVEIGWVCLDCQAIAQLADRIASDS
jgi:hypothetical protein